MSERRYAISCISIQKRCIRWKVQSVLQLSPLVAEHLDLVDINVVKSELSKEDRDMYIKNHISQPIARDDGDTAIKKNYG